MRYDESLNSEVAARMKGEKVDLEETEKVKSIRLAAGLLPSETEKVESRRMCQLPA